MYRYIQHLTFLPIILHNCGHNFFLNKNKKKLRNYLYISNLYK